MPLRLLQLTAPDSVDLSDLSESKYLVGQWDDPRGDGYRIFQLAVPAEKTETLMDDLEDRCGGREGFRMVLLEIEAVVPRLEEDKGDQPDERAGEEGSLGSGEAAGAGEDDNEPEKNRRISREELLADVTDGLEVSPIFLAMTVFSAVVAAVGLLRDDLAVIIGAMVIAPLLRPNVAMALAATLGDWKLAWKALRSNAAGVLLAVGLAAALGLVLPVDPEIPALQARTELDLGSLMLALAAGAAGTLAFTQGLSGAVIGVMVAVALMPPAVAFGLLLGAGHLELAFQALLLTAGNVICINLAGVGTFLAQGIRPRHWWEWKRAKKASLAAVGLWLFLFFALVAVLWISGQLEILSDPREAIR